MVQLLAMTTNGEGDATHGVGVGLGEAGGAFEGGAFCELSTDLDGSRFRDLAVPQGGVFVNLTINGFLTTLLHPLS